MTTQAPAGQTAEKPARDPWFDNAKFALVALVVVGHTWTLLPESSGAMVWLYDFLYFWHIPAFVLVTGCLSRRFDYTHARLWSLFRGVVVPYMVFELALGVFRIYVGGEHLEDLWADPHWPMWYLAAMFFWRLLTPPFRRSWLGVPVAVAVSLLAGVWATDMLDSARVLGLLPFFVLGLHLRPEHVARLHARGARIAGVVVLLVIFAAAKFTNDVIDTEWLYYRARYDELDPNPLQAMGIRLCLIVVGTVGALAFLTLVPARRTWMTPLGAGTLVVYLFHGFVVKTLLYTGATFSDNGDLGLLVLTPSALLLAVLLAWPPVARRLDRLVDPIGTVADLRRRRGLPPPGAPPRPAPTRAPTR